MSDVEGVSNDPYPPHTTAGEQRSIESTQQEGAPEKQSNAIEELINSCLVSKPVLEPSRSSRWRRKLRHLINTTPLAEYVLGSIWSVNGLLALIFGSAVVMYIIAIELGMSYRDAYIPAGCTGVLAPLVAISAIRLVGLLLRIAIPAIGVALAVGLIGLLGILR